MPVQETTASPHNDMGARPPQHATVVVAREREPSEHVALEVPETGIGIAEVKQLLECLGGGDSSINEGLSLVVGGILKFTRIGDRFYFTPLPAAPRRWSRSVELVVMGGMVITGGTSLTAKATLRVMVAPLTGKIA